MTAPPDSVAALQAALQSEHRAIFGYAALGPVLAGADAARARSDEAAHRNQRDRTAAALRTLRAVPSPSAISYAVPALGTATAAWGFARRLEDEAAAAWRYVIVQASAAAPTDITGPLRTMALTALTASSVRAMRWAVVIDAAHPTVAFPGI
jgi:hypothetical protein